MNIREAWSVATDPRLILNPVTWAKYLRSRRERDLEDAVVSFSVDLERNMRSEEPFEGVEESTLRLRDLFRERGVSATFFVTGRVAREFSDLVQELSRDFEVGYHGHEHGNWGEARWDMPEPLALEEKETFLDMDVSFFEELVGEPPTSFRAPRLNSSRETLDLLRRFGFHVDSSFPAFLGCSPAPFEEDGVTVVPVSSVEKPRLSLEPLPYFKFPFLDTYTLREMGNRRFFDLCREAATELDGDPFLAMFGHQWEFGSDGDLVLLGRFFGELVGLGAVFVEVRAVPGLAGVRAEAW